MGIKTTHVVLVISHGKNQIGDSGDLMLPRSTLATSNDL